MNTVSFPGLGLEFTLNRVAFHIGSWPVYWYGIIIAAGFVLAVVYCSKVSGRFGIQQDQIIDMLFFAAPIAIVGARLYYILFYPELFRNADGSLNFRQMLRIWDGGLAIYGAIIAAVVTLLVFCRVKKIKFLAFADLGVFGLFIGQMIGRWGNFMNVEAYGGPTQVPWRMCSESIANELWGKGILTAEADYWAVLDGTLGVHPTFLYECLWNLAGFLLLSQVAKRRRRFDGQMFLSYLAWYGLGRGLIEGLRTDSLMLFGTPIRVSQLLGFATAAVAAVLLFCGLCLRKNDPARLWVNRKKAEEKPVRLALVYPEGDADAKAWAEEQKARAAASGGYTEEYALPTGTPPEDAAELLESLRARSDLDEVLSRE